MQKSAATVQLHFALRVLKVSRSINEVRKESVSKFRDCELPWAFAAESLRQHVETFGSANADHHTYLSS
jgi:hypothetical protein